MGGGLEEKYKRGKRQRDFITYTVRRARVENCYKCGMCTWNTYMLYSSYTFNEYIPELENNALIYGKKIFIYNYTYNKLLYIITQNYI